MAFSINSMQKLTLGEVAAVEEMSGRAITDIGEPGVPLAKFMAAVAWVFKRRTDPNFTFDQALNLSMEDLDGVLGGAEPDPTGSAV